MKELTDFTCFKIFTLALILVSLISCNQDQKKDLLIEDAFPFLEDYGQFEEIELSFYYETVDQGVLHFKKVENHWVLPDFLGIRCSTNLNAMISDLREMDMSRFVSTDERVAQRRSIGKKSLRLKNYKGDVFVIEIGEEDGKGRRFIRNGNTGKIYLAKIMENWSNKPLDWMDKKLFDFVEEKEIKKIKIFSKAANPIVLKRSGNFFLEDGSGNLLGDQTSIPKWIAVMRGLKELKFKHPYPKSLWSEVLSEDSILDFEVELNSQIKIKWSLFSVQGKNEYVLQAQDSRGHSYLSRCMRDGIFTYSPYVKKMVEGLIR